MKNEKLYLGLDLGTNSCGWALTNQNYEIISKSGKSLHGVRLFEEAKTAAERRMKRGNRRRNDRKKWRIDLLQDLFKEEMFSIDPLFFIRLNNSFFHVEDKQSGLGKYNIFSDKLFTDKEYYKKFPTIYHLRQYLKNTNEKPDLRLVYLACHHILKYRGNFLMEGYEISSSIIDDKFFIETFNNTITELNEYIQEENYFDIKLDDSKLLHLNHLLDNQNSGMKLYSELNKAWNTNNLKSNQIILKIISGLTINIKDLILDESFEDTEIAKISFANPNFEEFVLPNLDDYLGEASQIVINLKKLFDWMVLKKLLGNSADISSAMIKIYEKHKKDLRILKNLIKENLEKTDYNDMFRNENIKSNYVNYVKTNMTENTKTYVAGSNRDDFIKYLKKVLSSINLKDNTSLDYVIEEINNDSFLPKLKSRSNSILPFQLHHNELTIILDNMSRFYPFLNKTENDITIKEKIKVLHKFRIPYYVGPLNIYHKEHGFAWAERTETGPVNPWNFSEKIDENKSAEKFIMKMTNKCSYLKGKDVLPKHSLLYSEFRVLNELNSLRVNGERLDTTIKEKIFNNLFKTKKKITQRDIINFFISEGYIADKKNISLSGIDGDFKNSLSSFIDFTKIFGNINYSNQEQIEKIIFYLTVFEDNGTAVKKIQSEMGFSHEILKKIKQLNYKGWGSLSKEFLRDEVTRIDDNGVVHSLISVLRSESLILQEAIFDKRFEFFKVIDEINNDEKFKDIKNPKAILDDSFVSPAVKRSILQATKIVDEVKKIVGKPIDKIFIEFTRKKEKSGRTRSRREQIFYLYKQAKIDAETLSTFLEQLNHVNDQQLRSDRLFFYFTQLGRCAYSNKPIDLDNIFSNTYDIDHIIPQSIIKDDSLNNRVLVYGNINKEKTDKYPVPASIQSQMLPIWKNWQNLNLISMEKFTRLTRKSELTDEEIGSFINRQLVFTNQATKTLAEILTKTNPDSKIIYSKAANVSEFRSQFDILKSREINDLHHAEDAYLNVVVGNTYNTKFGYDARIFLKNNKERLSTNTKKLFEKDVPGAWMSNGETIKIVRKMIGKNDKLFTKMQYIGKGMLYDETIYPKGEGLFPRKEADNSPLNDTLKYGGVKSLKNAYFALVKSKGKKNSEIYTVEAIPILYANKIKDGVITLEEVLKKYNGLDDPTVILPQILYNTYIELGGTTKVHLTGKSGDSLLIQNATQVYANYSITKYFRAITKYMQNKSIYNQEGNPNELVLSVREEEKEEIKLSKNMNLNVYDFLLNSISKKFFEHQVIGSYVEKLTQAKETFINLDVRKQAEILSEMVNLVRCNASKSDLSSISEKSKFLGGNMISKNISKISFKIIDASVTGFFERVRWSK